MSVGFSVKCDNCGIEKCIFIDVHNDDMQSFPLGMQLSPVDEDGDLCRSRDICPDCVKVVEEALNQRRRGDV